MLFSVISRLSYVSEYLYIFLAQKAERKEEARRGMLFAFIEIIQ